jgi:hypothetical protein
VCSCPGSPRTPGVSHSDASTSHASQRCAPGEVFFNARGRMSTLTAHRSFHLLNVRPGPGDQRQAVELLRNVQRLNCPVIPVSCINKLWQWWQCLRSGSTLWPSEPRRSVFGRLWPSDTLRQLWTLYVPFPWQHRQSMPMKLLNTKKWGMFPSRLVLSAQYNRGIVFADDPLFIPHNCYGKRRHCACGIP